jgi:hypothetical protein
VQARAKRRHHVDAWALFEFVSKSRDCFAIRRTDHHGCQLRVGNDLVDGAAGQHFAERDISDFMAALGLVHVMG